MRTSVDWPKDRKGKKDCTNFWKRTSKSMDRILTGRMLVIDPATTKAGWAMYEAGKLVDSGVIEINPKLPTVLRLFELYKHIQSLPKDIDLLVIERILGSMARPPLYWAVGVSIIAAGCAEVLEVNIPFWKAVVPKDYIKDDQKDAESMGLTVLLMAKEIKSGKAPT
jgi:hypothetical protein